MFDGHYMFKAYDHLKANPDCFDIEVEVLEQCAEENILEVEQRWLDKAKEDPNCLNIGFEARPSSADTRKANLKIKEQC